MLKLFTLFSSSAGNCTCLTQGGATLLIDAGGSCKKILTALATHGIDPKELCGIVLTHEHSDHIAALRVLLRRYPLPVFGTLATLEYLANGDLVPPGTELIPLAEKNECCDIAFSPFPTPHDAGDTCGYVFTLPSGQRVGFATDLGRFTDTVYENLKGCDLVVLESNYDQNMLEVSGYPYPLIRRIKSEHGHLSNDDCALSAVMLAQSGVSRLLLAHTSKQNNLEELALYTTLGALSKNGISERDMLLEVSPKFACSPVMTI